MHKQVLITLAKYGLGLGLLAFVVWSYWEPASGIGLKQALEKPLHLLPFLLASGLCLISILLTFIRWYVLVRAQDLPFTVPSAIRLGLIGYYLSTFLPGSVGGDIIKAAFIAREQSRRTVAVATVIIDRVIGLFGLFLLVALVGGFFQLTGQWSELVHSDLGRVVLNTIWWGSLGLAMGSYVFWFVLGFLSAAAAESWAGRLHRVPRIGPSLAELWRAVWMYRLRGQYVGLAVLLAMVGHVGFVLTFYFSACTLTAAERLPSLSLHFLLVPIGMTIQAGFPAPGGVGGGEFGFGSLYQWTGFEFAFGVLGSLVQRCINWMLGLVGYVVYLQMKPNIRVIRPKPSDGAPWIETPRAVKGT